MVVLQQIDEALIKLPSDEDIHRYQDAVVNCHPNLDGVWCTVDGLKLLLEYADDSDVQNQYYNGCTCDHYIGTVLVFCPDGTIAICCYNVPGMVHDSNIATFGKIYENFQLFIPLQRGVV